MIDLIKTKHLIRFIENDKTCAYHVRIYSDGEKAEYNREIIKRLRERDELLVA